LPEVHSPEHGPIPGSGPWSPQNYTRDFLGEITLAEAFALAAEPGIVAVGVNCCDPADVPAAVQLATATGEPAVVYPNTGETYADGAWTGTPHFRPGEALSWARAGATYIGGCCRVGPREIALIASEMSHLKEAEASGTLAE
jgi:homocysteine S-methyltransferase